MRALAFAFAFVMTACADAAPSPPVSGGDGCDERGNPDGGSPSSAADGGTELARPPGGYLKLERWTSGGEIDLVALAELDSGFTGPGRLPSTFYRTFPLDSCFQVPLLPAEPSDYDPVDVGESIALDGPAAIELARDSLLGTIFYRARPDDIPAGEYAVSIGGTLRVPPAPAGVELAFSSGSVALAWEPVGADHVFLIAQQDSIGRVCHLEDDGSFELPVDAAAGVPAWGTAVFLAMNRSTALLDGRAIELLGVQGQVADYERP
jgi:hypothetical protein